MAVSIVVVSTVLLFNAFYGLDNIIIIGYGMWTNKLIQDVTGNQGY